MANIAPWREQMIHPDREARWSINGHTMQAEGPWLKNAGRIEVVPAEQLDGAVERIKGLRERVNDDDPDRREREYARGYRSAVADALEVLVRGR